MNSKKKFSIKNTIALIMLKLMLKMLKNGMIPKGHIPLPSFIIIPKAQAQHIPKSDLFLEKKRILYKCGACGHKFVLKSDVNLNNSAFMEWMEGVKKHECHVNKKNTD